MRVRGSLPLVLAVMTSAGACASSGESGGVSRSWDPIGYEELMEIPHSTLYEAVRALRPRWLHARMATSLNDPRPATPRVYVDGQWRGGLDHMWTMLPSEVENVRFMDSRDATTRWGTNHIAGAIVISSKRR